MKNKFIFSALVLCIFNTAISQTTTINLTLFKDEILVNDSIQANVFIDNKRLNLIVNGRLLFIPDSLYGKKVNLVFSTNKYELNFYDLIIGWNKDYLYWSVYLDLPPFYKKWVVGGKLRKKKWVYAIERGNGTVITYYGYKRFRLTDL